MKTCPYCAEEIKDEAIRCRWCLTWLVDEIPATAEDPPKRAAMAETPMEAAPQATMMAPMATVEPAAAQPMAAEPVPAPASATPAAAAQPPVAEAKIEFTHTGTRYLLGYTPDMFGIWDRNTPQQPLETFPRNDEGWGAAWARYSSIETNWMDLRTGQKSG